MKPRTLMLYFGNTVLKYSFGVLNNAVVTEQVGGGSQYIITERIPPFCLWRSPHTHIPARFEMPAARGKTSLNTRDW